MEEESILREKLKGEFDARVDEKISQYHDLITREAAIYLLALEIFGPRVRAATLLQAKHATSPVKLRARLERVFPPKVYERAGKISKVQRIVVSDHSANGTVVCYDSCCEVIGTMAISGDLLSLWPVRYRNGEYHLSNRGKIEVAEKGKRNPLSGSDGIGNFEGEVSEFFGDFPFKKYNGGQGLMTTFSITDGEGTARIVYWDSPGLKGKLGKGDIVLIENGVRQGGEIHIRSASRIVFGKGGKNSVQMPKIEKVEVEGKCVRIFANGKEFASFGFEDACIKLGIGPMPEGVQPETALKLKAKTWVGREIPKEWAGG